MSTPLPHSAGFSVPGNRWDLLADAPPRLTSVAVIVPHYNQQHELDLVLTALDEQDYPPELLQIIVADDGSTHLPTVCTNRVPITVVAQENQGFRAAAARNLGVAHSDAEILCFLDADTVPQRDYVRRITALPSLYSEALVVGRRRHADFSGWTPQHLRDWWAGGDPPPELDEPDWLTDEYVRSRNLLDLHDHSYRYILSAVMCCTSALFKDIGGFDETFQHYGGEDWELAHRAITSGAVVQHARGAVAWHHGPDWAGRDVAARAAAKNAETLAVARLVPDADLRVPGLIYEIPAVAVHIDAEGHGPGSLLATIGCFIDLDVGIWVHGTEAVDLLTQLHLADPRIHEGPIPASVLRRCQHVVAATARAVVARTALTDLLRQCSYESPGATTVQAGRAQLTCAASWAFHRALRRRGTSVFDFSAAALAELTGAADIDADCIGVKQVAAHHPC